MGSDWTIWSEFKEKKNLLDAGKETLSPRTQCPVSFS